MSVKLTESEAWAVISLAAHTVMKNSSKAKYCFKTAFEKNQLTAN